MVHKRGTQYPGVRGKVVEFMDHSFAEGHLFISVRFQDHTEVCWRVDCALILRGADLADWTGGNFRKIKTFVGEEQDDEL